MKREQKGNFLREKHLLLEKGVNHLTVTTPEGVKVGDNSLVLLDSSMKCLWTDEYLYLASERHSGQVPSLVVAFISTPVVA